MADETTNGNPGRGAGPAPVDPAVAVLRNGARRHRADAPPSGERLRSLEALLRRLPLFYKILVANVLVVLLVSVVAPLITERVEAHGTRPTVLLVVGLAVVGVAVSVLVNVFILRVALAPLDQLEETARRVQAGELDARAPISPLADQELARLIRAFNGMLDGIAGYRRRLRDVAARALNAAEDERRRIALELHDETSQNLAALMLRLRVLRSVRDDHRRAALIEELRQEMADILEGTRRYARGLRPPALDELGLGAAIESHARAVAEMTDLDIAVEIADGPAGASLAPEAELALYRIMQEGLSNVARHAGAQHARVRLDWQDDAVVASIEDDGRGFDVDEVMAAEDRGLGLFGMVERADYLGGRVEVESEPGGGTVVRATIPRRMEHASAGPTAPPAEDRS